MRDYDTSREDRWDFGTVGPRNRHTIADLRELSYGHSSYDEPSSNHERPGRRDEWQQDPHATIKEVRKPSAKAKLTIGAQDHEDHTERYFSMHDTISTIPNNSGDDANHFEDTFGRADMVFTLRDKGTISRSEACRRTSHNGPAAVPARIWNDRSPIISQVLLPAMAQLRAQATGYPVALRSIDKLQDCLFEVENETNGLVDTFILNLVQNSNLLEGTVRS